MADLPETQLVVEPDKKNRWRDVMEAFKKSPNLDKLRLAIDSMGFPGRVWRIKVKGVGRLRFAQIGMKPTLPHAVPLRIRIHEDGKGNGLAVNCELYWPKDFPVAPGDLGRRLAAFFDERHQNASLLTDSHSEAWFGTLLAAVASAQQDDPQGTMTAEEFRAYVLNILDIDAEGEADIAAKADRIAAAAVRHGHLVQTRLGWRLTKEGCKLMNLKYTAPHLPTEQETPTMAEPTPPSANNGAAPSSLDALLNLGELLNKAQVAAQRATELDRKRKQYQQKLNELEQDFAKKRDEYERERKALVGLIDGVNRDADQLRGSLDMNRLTAILGGQK